MKNAIDKHLQHSIDQLLRHQGEYTPLELLLAEGRLAQHDYDAWRCGNRPRLDTALFGDPDQIRHMLAEAQRYVSSNRLPLQAQPLTYERWGANGGQTLRFSDNDTLNDYFHTGYRKAENQPQMDFFIDAPSVNLAGGIAQALRRGNYDDARPLLGQLIQNDPGHARLGSLEQLVDAATRLNAPVNDLAAELDFLHNVLTPAADDALGRNAGSVLIPHWRHLDDALQNTPFDPHRPTLHSSYTATRALDWATARAAVERETDWQRHAVLLQRHVIACAHLQDRSAALLSRFELCWRHPEHTQAIVADDYELQNAWQLFLDLEPELKTEDFPAWLLLHQPALINILPAPEREDGPRAVYVLVYRLQNATGGNAAPETSDIALREQLKHLNPPLFEHFLIRRR